MSKPRLVLVSIIIFLFVISSAGETRLSFSPGSVNPGDTVAIPIVLSSSETVCGYQFNIPPLPEPLELIQIQFGEQTLPGGAWTLTSNQLYNGIYKIVGFDEGLVGFSGENHELARLIICADALAWPGIYPLIPENQIVCDEHGNVIPSLASTEYLTITGGDVVFDLVSDTMGYYDRSKRLTILMSTYVPVAGFQFDIVDSADIFTGISCNNPFGEGWEVYCAEQDDGSLRILATAPAGELLPDSADYQLLVTVAANSDVQAGSYPVSLDNIIVSDEHAGSLIGSGAGAIIEVDSTLLSSFDLLAPVSGSQVDVSAGAIEFSWNRSTFPADPLIDYRVCFQVKGYDELAESFVSDSEGSDTTLLLNIDDLRRGIEARGIPVQNPLELFWWVVASNGSSSRRSETMFDMEIKGFTAIAEYTDRIPGAYRLYQNYPNPFNSQTTIGFEIPEAAAVKMTIYNVLGQKVRTLTDNSYPAGHYTCFWDGLNQDGEPVESGIYLLMFQAGDYYGKRKMVFLK